MILPIDFIGQGALLEPKDKALHDAAVEYCARELEGGKDLNLAQFAKCWVATDGLKISGIAGYVNRIDIPVFRITGNHVDYFTQMMIERLRSYFQDNGIRGHEVMLHISSKEKPEQRCENWEKALAAVGAVPADRFMVKV